MKMKRLLMVIFGSAVVGMGVIFLLESEKVLLPLEKVSPSLTTVDDIDAIKSPEIKRVAFQEPKDIEVNSGDLPREEIEDSIANIDSALASANAVERLNQNIASEEERINYEKLFKTRDRLIEQKLSLKVADLNQKISDLEKHHASRLATYGINHDENFAE